MKSHLGASIVLGLALGAAACEDSAADPSPAATAAEEQPVQAASSAPPHYLVFKLRGLGGTLSSGNSLNDLGLIGGTSNRTGDAVTRATVWFLGIPFDLGTLGGPSSGIIWPVKNLRGIVSGIAETADDQPLGENWSCSAFLPASGKVCRGFVWQAGRMRQLPTLGGDNGFATGTNNLAQTVGWAENTVHDATCTAPQVLQFRAVLWGPGRDQMRELPPFGDDSTSAATAINDRGQVVGISGECNNAVGRRSARHAVMWQNGRPVDLGNIGGTFWNTPMALNEHGTVIGFANQANTVPETKFNAHAFIWKNGGPMVDLKALDGDTTSQGLGLNGRDDAVGISCPTNGCSAVLWRNGQLYNLNDLKAPGSTDEHLFAAGDINDLGVIAGQTVAADGSQSTFLALPVP